MCTLHTVIPENDDKVKSLLKPNGKVPGNGELELELELIQFHMAQKPVPRGEVGCACVAREVSVERGGI